MKMRLCKGSLTHSTATLPQQAAERYPLEVCWEPLCGGVHGRVPVLRGNICKWERGAQGWLGGVVLKDPHEFMTSVLLPPSLESH